MRPYLASIRVLFLLISLGMAAHAQGESHTRQPVLNRRPLARIRSWIKGTDLDFKVPGGAFACQGTPVAKKEVSPGTCRVAFLTAAHCTDVPFKTLKVFGLGEIPRENIKIVYNSDYLKTKSQANSRESRGGDSATVVTDAPCDKVENIIPVPLAPTENDGTTSIDPQNAYLQKRQGKIPGNRGEGAQIKAEMITQSKDQFHFKVPSPQGYAIVGGDSGGPIFNEKGQLICPISGSSYEAKRINGELTRPREDENSLLDPFEVTCDKRAISKLKQALAQFGLSPESGFGNDTAASQPSQSTSQQPNKPAAPQDLGLRNRQTQAASSPSHGSGSPIRSNRPEAPSRSSSSSLPVFNGIEFSANDQNALESRPVDKPDANTPLFLLKKDGVRRAAYKNPEGGHTVAPENMQEALKQYYEAHPEEVSRLPERQQRYVQEFLSGAKQSVAQLNPQDTPQAQSEKHQTQETPKKEELAEEKRTSDENSNSDFECASTPKGFFPRKKGGRSKLLGTSGYPKRELCDQAVQNSRNGLICSYTGLGWKPTHFSGATEWERKVGREPHGYIGGSSIENFSDCLKATSQSTPEGVCYWDGTSAWRVHDSQGLGNVPNGINPRGYQTIDQCVLALHKGEKAPTDQLQAKTQQEEPNKEEKKEPENKEAEASTKKEAHKDTTDFEKTHSVYGQHCASCHRPGESGGIIPAWATDTSELEKRLSSSDGETQKEAKKWIEKMHKVLVDQDSMPPNDESRARMAKDPQVAALKRFLEEHAPEKTTTALAANAVQPISDPKKLDAYRKVLAGTKVKDSEVQAILTDPNTIIIDQKSMPSAYQDTSLPVEGARPSGHGTFVDGAPFLDGDNKLKMFGHGAGLSNDTKTFHLLSLPKDSKGNLEPIDYYVGKDGRDGGSRFGWKLPQGTTSLELVTATDSQGQTYIQEIRKRKHDGNPQGAEVDIFTATPSKSDLQRRLTAAAEKRPDLAAEIERVQSGLKQAPVKPIEIPNAYRVALGSKGATVSLPEMSEDLVKEVLGQGLVSSKGVWDTKDQLQAYAPTTQQTFGVVPQGSQRGAIPVTRQSCNSCHSLGDTRIRDLYQYDHLSGGSFKSLLDKTTFLYGSTPGNSNLDQRDGSNLRFHLFEGSLLPSFGNDQKGDNRRINPRLAPILRRVPAPNR